MTRSRDPWNIHPAKKVASISPSLRIEFDTKAQKLIDRVLKPKYVRPPRKDEQFNYVIDIGAKWFKSG